jgi:hypothetical protein
MLASIQPFLSAELDYHREQVMAGFAGSRRHAIRPSRVRSRSRGHLVPRLVRRAFAGH